MAGFTVDASEMNQLAVDLTASTVKVPALARVAVAKTCADTKRDAQAMAPVDTGFLRSSITYETTGSAGGAEGVVGPTASYGRYVEDGTSRMGPHPYMGPAFDRNVPAFVEAFERIAASMDL
jgi:HK97 gp10 family phage protein